MTTKNAFKLRERGMNYNNFYGYHANCFDGAASAAAALMYQDGCHVPMVHGTDGNIRAMKEISKFLTQCSERNQRPHVYLLDFSLSPEACDDVDRHCTQLGGQFRILDHHKSAMERLGNRSYAYFDMDMSGATVTWTQLHPDKEIPLFFRYVEDRDLWRFKLPFSREINAWIGMHGYDPYRYMELVSFLSTVEGFSRAVEIGQSVLKTSDTTAELICQQSKKKKWQLPDDSFVDVVVVNSTSHWSEVGDRLRDENVIGVSWYLDANDCFVFSLRSVGDTDVQHIARMFKGGGHKHAAGFSLHPDETDNSVRRTFKCLLGFLPEV